MAYAGNRTGGKSSLGYRSGCVLRRSLRHGEAIRCRIELRRHATQRAHAVAGFTCPGCQTCVMKSETDDRTIREEERLLRRIPLVQIVRDDNRGSYRVSSAAFTNSSDGSGMSVSIETILQQCDLAVETVLRGYDGCGLVALTAGFVRMHGQGVVKKPQPDDPSHGEVVGKKTRSTQRAFARRAKWVVRPELDKA